MKTSKRLAGYWDDAKEGFKWQRKEVPAIHILLPLICMLQIAIIIMTEHPFVRVVNSFMVIATLCFIVFIHISSGRHAKRMQEADRLAEEFRETMQAATNGLIAMTFEPVHQVYAELPEEDIPDEDF